MTEGGHPHYMQLGVVQGGISRCGSREHPAIYVRTTNEDVMDFILETSGLDEGQTMSVSQVLLLYQ